MSIYRPAGYGPAPTVEEHRAAPWAPDYDIHITDWLHRRSAGGAVQVRTLCEYGGRLLYNGASSDLSGEWCLLDIATGLPCAIGTPPETERWVRWVKDGPTFILRQRNGQLAPFCVRGLAEAIEEAGRQLREVEDLVSALPALADHIIKEQTP